MVEQTPAGETELELGSTVTIVDRACPLLARRGLRVAVLSGGRSSEHDISLASARAVAAGLREAGFEPVAIEISRDGRWRLAPASPGQLPGGGDAHGAGCGLGARPALLSSVDVVFPVLHGPFGEDGTVQGLLELADVPYVGPGVAASAVAMDKDLFKAVMRQTTYPSPRASRCARRRRPGLSRARSATRSSSSPRGSARASGSRSSVTEPELATRARARVPPRRQGARGGVRARRRDRVQRARERGAGRLGGGADRAEAGGLVRLRLQVRGGRDGARRAGPASLRRAAAAARELAVRSFRACDAEGMARVDMFLRDDGEVLVNELNTIPGFTSTSVYARLFDASGVSVRRAAAPARRARARAPRAPPLAAVLAPGLLLRPVP